MLILRINVYAESTQYGHNSVYYKNKVNNVLALPRRFCFLPSFFFWSVCVILCNIFQFSNVNFSPHFFSF